MAVFGDQTSYTNKSTSTAAAKIADSFSPSTTGVTQSLTILLDMLSGTTTARGVIYADNAGVPGALLAVSDAQTISGSTLTAYTFNFTGANQIQVNSGTSYWIGAYWQTPTGAGTIEWGRGTTASAADKASDTATGPATTFGTASAISGPLGVYVTYNDTLSITSHYVKKIGSVAGNSAASIQVAGPTTAGDTIIVGVTWYTGSGSYPTCAVTDSKGNTYTVLSSYTGSSTTGPSHLVAIATGATALTSGDHITATFTGTAPFSVMGADEWDSTVSATLDGSVVQGNVTSASTAVSFSGYSNINATDLVLVYIGSFGNLTATTWPNAFTTNDEFQSSAPTLSWSWAQTADATSFSDRATLSAAEIYAYSIIGLEAPAAGGPVTVTPGVASLTASTFAPVIALAVIPGVLALSLSTLAPTVSASDNKTVTPGVASLATSTFAPTVTTTNDVAVTPSTPALTLSTFAPTIVLPQAVIPSVANLIITAHPPQVNLAVIPSTTALTLATFAPTVSATNNQTVIPGIDALTLTTFAPQLNLKVTPSTTALTLTKFAPTISPSDNQIATPGVATLALTTFSPRVNLALIPAKAALALATFAPTVIAPSGAIVIPGTRALVITPFAPTISGSHNQVIVPDVLHLIITTFVPAVISHDIPVPASLWADPLGTGYSLGAGSVPAGASGFKTVNSTGVAFGAATPSTGPGFKDVTPASGDEWRKRLS